VANSFFLRASRFSRNSLRRQPVSLSLAFVFLLCALATGFLTHPSPDVKLTFGTGYASFVELGHWWSPVTSLFFTGEVVERIIVLAALLIIVGSAERLMGSARTILAFLVAPIVGTIVGLGLQTVGTVSGELWSRSVREFTTLDPLTAISGTIMAASAFTGPLWRRRIRVVVLASVMIFLLYSGQPSDLYRVLSSLSGLLLGYVLRAPTGEMRWHRSSHHEVRTLLSSVVVITAVGPLITVLSGSRFGPLGPLGLLLTQSVRHTASSLDRCQALNITRECLNDMVLDRISGVGPVLLTLLPVLTLLVAAFGLAHGRRMALWLAVAVDVALSVLAAYYYGFLPIAGQHYVFQVQSLHYWEVTISLVASVLLPLAIVALLLRNLSHFGIRTSPRQIVGYLVTVVLTLVVLSALYLGVGLAMSNQFKPQVSFLDLLSDLPERFIPVGFLRREQLAFIPATDPASILYYWIGPIFWIVLVCGALAIMYRSAVLGHTENLPHIQQLVRRGGGSLSSMATWPGNSYWFRVDGRSAVAYRVINNVAITTSEPVGDPDAAELAVAEFSVFCDDHGWTPVFYSVHEWLKPAFDRMGWQVMVVGEETVIRPQQWSTAGKQWQDVRTAISRAEREEIRSEWCSYASLTLANAAQIAAISELWVAEKDLPEMGFTLGGLDELHDPGVRLMLAIDSEDTVLGVTSWLPSYRDGTIVGWTLDFMRRSPNAIPGVMEFLIARSAEQIRSTGAEFMSLSAAPLARSTQPAEGDATRTTRLLSFIGSALEPVYGFRSLLQFKRKFQPEFHPLLMAYPDPLFLPAIGLALSRAYLPDMSVGQTLKFLRSLG
jgi:phosphatidylglycerol lysyltransferase